MKKLSFILVLLSVLFFSCSSPTIESTSELSPNNLPTESAHTHTLQIQKLFYDESFTLYNKENSEIRDVLIHLAAEDALPNNVGKNEEFIKAAQYYTLSKDEPYNWNSEYSEFWEVFQKGMEALKSN